MPPTEKIFTTCRGIESRCQPTCSILANGAHRKNLKVHTMHVVRVVFVFLCFVLLALGCMACAFWLLHRVACQLVYMACLCNRCCGSVHIRRRCDDASMAMRPGCALLSIVLAAVARRREKWKVSRLCSQSITKFAWTRCASLVGMRSRIEQLRLIGFHFSRFSLKSTARTMSRLTANHSFCWRTLYVRNR